MVPSVIRVYLTGVERVPASLITVRIGDKTILGQGITSDPVLFEPGVYTFDFILPADLQGTGDQPIIVTVNVEGVIFTSRVDDTASRVAIL
jgi:hypothetical protein